MMYEFIKEITDKLGGRVPGSIEEKQGQQMYKERMLQYTSDVTEQPFVAPMNAKFASMKLFCIGFYIALGLYWVSIEAAAILAAVNAIFFLGHVVTYRDWLDFLFPKGTSLNVTATLEPTDEVKSTILVAGHMDSVYEFQWWYKLKMFGAFLTFLSGFLFSLLGIFYVVTYFAGFDLAGNAQYVWALFLLLSPSTIVMFTIHGKTKVDGAIDNLSGVAIAMGTGVAFADKTTKGKSTLKHTRLKLVSFGAEEPGLKGSGAYVKEFEKQLKEENAVLLNIDSVKSIEKLAIVRSETNILVMYPKDLVNKMKDAYVANGVKPHVFDLSIGGTDAARFALKGLPAITIVGIESAKLDETYHTRLDKVENIDPASLEKARDILVSFIKKWDNNLTIN